MGSERLTALTDGVVISPLFYLAGIALAFIAPLASYAIYAGIAVAWLMPDRRVEAALASAEAGERRGAQ